ncbi:efflux RND transporter permease subunit [Pseudoalteromonas luteoviolacea]|uniref:Cation/multidrug efflux pump n=1 Tax=Pseudoalteromonas luteoviolacea (strain 2ta16) TaxID=1353533 RepID=V4HRI1_PSEL2|nr:efflux RND transporter permease subunit [Pseudoalteromonas luteoviolacea]ESP93420.1 Cation/multidrug efflux pump [Pseudoalteromonas luteoviolacea 2ta16]KZN43895.1 hypothetical protein N483_08215 [Pseudoalteromonas luteoviolacea NCIMB 1944]
MSDSVKHYWYQNPRLIVGIVFILALVGFAGWFSASEQEDPQFPYRNGFVSLTAPNMTIAQLRDAAVVPLERTLSNIDEVSTYQSRIKNGNAVINIELHEHIYDTDTVWERIKDDITSKQSDMLGISANIVDRAQDTQGIVIAITQPSDILAKRALAIELRTELEQLSTIRSVNLVGDPHEQIVIDYTLKAMQEFGVTPEQIAQRLSSTSGRGASFQAGGITTNTNPLGRLQSIDDIKNSQVSLDNANPVSLSTIADIYYRPNPIAPEQFMVNGQRVVGLAISLPANTVRVTEVGDAIRQVVEEFNLRFANNPAKIVLFQPKWTKKRKSDLLNSLATGCIAVAVILILLMSVRTAIVVVVTIPAIALSALGFFTAAGGVLHQMTIAGLVISLGLMVDNSIVMAEKILQLMDKGKSHLEASKLAVKDLYKPLATATITTIAAFLPMLLAKGSVADFISTIPILVILCISLSYLIALSFVPVMANCLFQSRHESAKRQSQFSVIGNRIAQFSLANPKTVIIVMLGVLILIPLLPSATGEFFPKTNRNQGYVDIQLPLGSDITKTANLAQQISQYIQTLDFVTQTLTFSGSSGPRFYYNLVQQPGESHIARVVFEVTEETIVGEVVEQFNTLLPQAFDGALILAREFGQGPPIESPIEIRLISNQTEANLKAAENVFMLLNEQTDTAHVRRDYSYGVVQLSMLIEQQSLKQVGLNESALADYLAWQGTGLHLSDLTFKTEPITLLLQDTSSNQTVERIMSTQVVDHKNQFLPISAFVNAQLVGEKAVETRRNGREELRILSDVTSGTDESILLESLQPALLAIAKKHGVTLQFGGELEESQEANSALLLALPAGIILLFIALILQFNSYKLTVLVMMTIPFSIVGAPIMLSLVGVPFGFMSLLGILALVGIVVNTAILLIEKSIEGIIDGHNKDAAIRLAVSNRLRAIMLTTITTIIGMLPLTSGESPLWPPLAWTVIGGLISSTLMMLYIMPILMSWLIEPNRYKNRINVSLQ